MPAVSEAQRRAMYAAKAGKSTLGIPKKVGAEFIKADKGGKLPARTTTGAAADKTVREMVKASKSGKGTLTYTPNKGAKR